jgi:hypothetical protein
MLDLRRSAAVLFSITALLAAASASAADAYRFEGVIDLGKGEMLYPAGAKANPYRGLVRIRLQVTPNAELKLTNLRGQRMQEATDPDLDETGAPYCLSRADVEFGTMQVSATDEAGKVLGELTASIRASVDRVTPDDGACVASFPEGERLSVQMGSMYRDLEFTLGAALPGQRLSLRVLPLEMTAAVAARDRALGALSFASDRDAGGTTLQWWAYAAQAPLQSMAAGGAVLARQP